MAEADFFEHPQHLGRPIPLDEHAVSVSLPTWADVVGYEEGEKRVTDAMKIGYPRFKVHICIEKLIEIMRVRHSVDSSMECIILPSQSTAATFVRFLGEEGSTASIQEVGYASMRAVFYPSIVKGKGKQFWQHSGEIVSSRLAEDALLALGGGDSSQWGVTATHSKDGSRYSASDSHMAENLLQSTENVLQTIKARISSIIQEPEGQISICVSGMAAIYGALKCVQGLGRQSGSNGRVVVFGFPYLDTLKVRHFTTLRH